MCEGILIFPDKTEVAARCVLKYNRKRFYRARARILLDVDQEIKHAINDKYVLGIFYCSSYTHDNDDHIFGLTAIDTGCIGIYEDTENLIIDATVLHLTDNKYKHPVVDREN